MDTRTITSALERIAQYHTQRPSDQVILTLHGGEPLLAGLELILGISEKSREIVAPITPVQVELQSNGTLLTDGVLNELQQAGIRVGISLDGDVATNDKYRVNHRGYGTYSVVSIALQKLAVSHRSIFSGILCVVHPESDPRDVYAELARWEPPVLDLLLPSCNWEHPPKHRAKSATEANSVYGTWLAAIFDVWYVHGPRSVRVRLFEEILHSLLGGSSTSTAIGSSTTPGFIVIDTNGSYQLTDRLKSAYDGAASLNMDVARHSILDVLSSPKLQRYFTSAARVATECRSCDLVAICGGGSPPHRYSNAKYLDNPSVFCEDLYFLIQHIKLRVLSDLRDVMK